MPTPSTRSSRSSPRTTRSGRSPPQSFGYVPELAAARMAQSLLISAWRAELHPDNVDYILADADDCFATLALLDQHDPAALASSLADACGVQVRPPASLAASLALREARLGPALSLSYDEPDPARVGRRRLAHRRRRQPAPRRLQQRAAGGPLPSARDRGARRAGATAHHQHALPRGRGGCLRRPARGAASGRALGRHVRQLRAARRTTSRSRSPVP